MARTTSAALGCACALLLGCGPWRVHVAGGPRPNPRDKTLLYYDTNMVGHVPGRSCAETGTIDEDARTSNTLLHRPAPVHAARAPCTGRVDQGRAGEGRGRRAAHARTGQGGKASAGNARAGQGGYGKQGRERQASHRQFIWSQYAPVLSRTVPQSLPPPVSGARVCRLRTSRTYIHTKVPVCIFTGELGREHVSA